MVRFAPAALALLALSACNSGGGDATNGATPVGNVAAVPPPAGSSWSQQARLTPEGGILIGNPDAPVKLLEFASYTCPHCANFSEQSHSELAENYIDTGRVSLEFRNYVVNALDMTVALLARCSGPEAFYPLSAQLFANQNAMITQVQAAGDADFQRAASAPPEQRFIGIAELAGLIDFVKQRGVSEEQAKKCLADTKAVEALAANVQRDAERYNVPGTPAFYMNGSLIENTSTWPALQERLKQTGL